MNDIMPSKPTFSRGTIVAACGVLYHLTNNEFDQLMLKFGVDAHVNSDLTLPKKLNKLSAVILANPSMRVELAQGETTLAMAIVEHAAMQTPYHSRQNDRWKEFQSYLERDGFTLIEKQDGRPWEHKTSIQLQRMHPDVADIPAADDEVHTLLKQHRFDIPLGHLDQAINAHARGDWAAANSQLRTFMEGLFDQIAERLAPEEAAKAVSSNSRRAVLANLPEPFLSRALNEWSDGNKPALIPGLFNRLHPEGSHPGLSDGEDATFRLYIVLITARLILRRYAMTASARKAA